jgi:hypothetical protein
MRLDPARAHHSLSGGFALAVILLSAVATAGVSAAPLEAELAALVTVDHVVISEVMTGGTSASDEFVELYNPGPVERSLDGLELVYVTATGATITRKAAWGPGAQIAGWSHLLIANDAGIFAGIADLTYANGLAATGGSMALRAVAAATAVDAVGWGTASSTWREGPAAPAAPAGSSLERLPGGSEGSGQDSDQNAVDFIVRAAPDPQNAASSPVPASTPSPDPSLDSSDPGAPSPTPNDTTEPTASPSAAETATPVATATPAPTPSPTPIDTPSPTPSPSPTTPLLSVVDARALPDGSSVRLRGVSLSTSDFHEGGGYLADETGGIAILVTGGEFPRGIVLTAEGTVDDRYAQRTLRVDVEDLIIGPAADAPAPIAVETGAIGEQTEGRLVRLVGVIQGAPTDLAAGLAFEMDDGSGPIRVLVGPTTGIETSAWQTGVTLTVSGIVGQRDSSGTGSEGYRVQPRDPADIGPILPSATPEPTPEPAVTPTPSATPTSTASPTPNPNGSALVTIAQARRAEVGARVRIRGVVVLPTSLVEEGSAIVADTSGAILVRVGSDVGRLNRGQLVELIGTRSTKSGMLSLRVTTRAVVLGTQPEPQPARRATGRIREADEATVVVVRGLVKDGPRRTSGGGLSFTVNDGSGPIRVFVATGTGITTRHVPAGAWIELRAVVGQQTTGAQPNAGYRLWPRDRADVTVIAKPRASGGGSGSGTPGTSPRKVGPPPTMTPRPAVILTRPRLGGSAILATGSGSGKGPTPAGAPPAPPIPVPLAAGLGSVAGLLTLAWRHGTLGRARVELEQRTAAIRGAGVNGNEEDESYTSAP